MSILPVLCALLQAVTPPPTVYNGRAHQLDVAAPRIEATPVIDGVLDEPAWTQAAVLTGFSQYRPVDGLPAHDSTEVLVWYSPDAIYFGIRAFEPDGAVVRATLADRDNIDSDDNIQILLDTYDDHRRALMFAVNPLGIQEDGVRSEGQQAAAGGSNATGRFDGIIDLNPDFVWQSRGHVTPWGYEVEVRIPYRSLRFQGTDPQTWGLQIVRMVQHSGYEDEWTPVVRASASFLIQSGRLVGLTDLHRGVVADFIPEFTARVNGDTSGTRYGYRAGTALGATARIGITNGLTMDATAHPDFSQVEADAAQVTVNQRFALFYPEKRPFFLEGLERYDTPNQLIYTRQIVQPAGGVKLTGKTGPYSIAFLSAVDQRDSAGPNHPVYDVLRVTRDFGASSTLGMVYTDRIDGGDYNRVAGADARVLWGGLWFSAAQVVGSWTRDSLGHRTGGLWDVTIADRTGRAYGNHFELVGLSPEFLAASGFVNRTGIVQGRFFNRATVYGAPGSLFEQVTMFVNATPLWRYDQFERFAGSDEGGISLQWTATMRGGWNLNASVNDNLQRFDTTAYTGYAVAAMGDTTAFVVPHGLYGLVNGGGGISTPSRALVATLSFTYGASVIYAEAAEGRETTASLNVTWRPTPSIRVNGTWAHDRITRARDGSQFGVADIPRLKLEYQLNRAIFVRYIGQYVAQRQTLLRDPRTDAPLVQRDSIGGAYSALTGSMSNEFRNDVLLAYKPVPGTVLFLGYGASLVEPNAFAFDRLQRTMDGFFLKASYLFRL